MQFLTNQEIFDRVATHLLTQGQKSKDVENLRFAYRTEEGLRCAVGCMIPEDVYERYSLSIEGEGARSLDSDFYAECGIDRSVSIGLLVALQKVHDDLSVKKWHRELGSLAQLFGLSSDALEKAPAPAL